MDFVSAWSIGVGPEIVPYGGEHVHLQVLCGESLIMLGTPMSDVATVEMVTGILVLPP